MRILSFLFENRSLQPRAISLKLSAFADFALPLDWTALADYNSNTPMLRCLHGSSSLTTLFH